MFVLLLFHIVLSEIQCGQPNVKYAKNDDAIICFKMAGVLNIRNDNASGTKTQCACVSTKVDEFSLVSLEKSNTFSKEFFFCPLKKAFTFFFHKPQSETWRFPFQSFLTWVFNLNWALARRKLERAVNFPLFIELMTHVEIYNNYSTKMKIKRHRHTWRLVTKLLSMRHFYGIVPHKIQMVYHMCVFWATGDNNYLNSVMTLVIYLDVPQPQSKWLQKKNSTSGGGEKCFQDPSRFESKNVAEKISYSRSWVRQILKIGGAEGPIFFVKILRRLLETGIARMKWWNEKSKEIV